MSDGAMEAAPLLREAMSLREKWMGRRVGGGTASPPAEPLTAAAAKGLQYEMVDGIMRVAGESPRDAALFAGHSVADFIVDTDRVAAIRGTGPAVSYSYQRLRLLEAQYNVHCMLNGEMETKEMMAIPHRDFYNVRKVDTHVHHSASMNVSRAPTTKYRKIAEAENYLLSSGQAPAEIHQEKVQVFLRGGCDH
eukprot:COSAG06_NODE_19471_length_836_cov_2.932157_1_plen_192_part_10